MTGNEKKMKMRLLVPVIFLLVLFGACNLKNQGPDSNSSESFSRIYDKNDNHTYTAIDIKKTADGGYIILGMVDGVPYLLKISRNGEPMWDTTNAEGYNKYRQPIKNLLKIKGEYHFFCNQQEMTEGAGLRNFALLKVNQNGEPEEIDIIGKNYDFIRNNYIAFKKNNLYALRPLHTVNTSSEFVLLLIFSEKYDEIFLVEIDDDYKMKFFNNTIKYRCAYANPFLDKRSHFAGQIGTNENDVSYYFQSYSSETDYENSGSCFSVREVMPEISNSTLSQQDVNQRNNPFIAMEWDDNYSYKALIKDDIVSFSANPNISAVEDENTHKQPELIESKAVYIKTMIVKERKMVFFLGSSKNNKIVLYAYDADYSAKGLLRDGFTKKVYFGYTHIYEAAALIETDDKELALLGTTYVAGQLGRICVFKLSKEKLENLLFPENN